MERCFYAFLQYGAHCIWFGGSFDAHHLFAQGILIEYYIMNNCPTNKICINQYILIILFSIPLIYLYFINTNTNTNTNVERTDCQMLKS